MAHLPTGTVTFLFTDIEGSTTLWEQHPGATRAALVRHDVLVEQVVAQHDGHVVRPRGEGDSRFAVFARATDAVAAAAALQKTFAAEPWPTPTPLGVRMALHTGEADLREGDYYGSAVNRCARLRAVAHAGQTLVSLATQELVRDGLPADITLRDLGEHRLRDLIHPERIFQLVLPALPTDFPPLKTLDVHPNNLTVQRDPLIGREREVEAVAARLRRDDVCLVTLTGVGGSGKTRLALQVAAELLDDFPDGVWFVDLAPITDPTLVASMIATTLGVKGTAGTPILETLQAFLRQKQLLLLLDNFEQIVAAAPLLADLLKRVPQLKLLVTSRVVLHLSQEHESPVPPLALPEPVRPGHPPPPLERLTQYAAVELFIQRAQRVKPDFQVTNQSAPAVAEICVRLDGLPLAIELAAARTKLLAPQALLPRLQQRLHVLTGGARDLPARQQTLRSTIDWSYHLLDAGEQRLFARLGVFVGGCTLEAIEAVCNPQGELPVDVLDGLQSLVDKNLVRQMDEPDGEPRFTMFETIREYALEQVVARGKAEATRRAHAAYYVAFAESADLERTQTDDARWLARLEREHDNVRGVLQWARERNDVEIALRLGAALWLFWLRRGYWSEGRRWLTAALQQTEGCLSPPSGHAPQADLLHIRARALLGCGWLAWNETDTTAALALTEASLALFRELGDPWGIALALDHLGQLVGLIQQDWARGVAMLEESLALRRELDDKRGIAFALNALGIAAFDQQDYARAAALQEESLSLFRATGYKYGISILLLNLGVARGWLGDDVRATALFEEALALCRALGDKEFAAYPLYWLAIHAWDHGDYARATELAEQSLDVARELGSKRAMAGPLLLLGVVARDQGDPIAATARCEASLRLFHEVKFQPGIVVSLNALGVVAVQQGEYERAAASLSESLTRVQALEHKPLTAQTLEAWAVLAAGQRRALLSARLFGAAEMLRNAVGARHPPFGRLAYDHNVAAARAQLDERAFAAAWAEGRAMTLEQAIAHALEDEPDA